jgi:hypothetical protein
MKLIFANLLYYSLMSSTIHANECFNTKTKIIFDGKPELEKITLCQKKTPDNMLFLTSKSCLNDQCEILKRPKKNLIIKNYVSNIGSPGFKLCEELGGVPQIFDFLDPANKWLSSERCFFGKSDFVEISLLTREWKIFIQTK